MTETKPSVKHGVGVLRGKAFISASYKSQPQVLAAFLFPLQCDQPQEQFRPERNLSAGCRVQSRHFAWLPEGITLGVEVISLFPGTRKICFKTVSNFNIATKQSNFSDISASLTFQLSTKALAT